MFTMFTMMIQHAFMLTLSTKDKTWEVQLQVDKKMISFASNWTKWHNMKY